MSKRFVNPADYIVPININGMDGRLMRLENGNRHSKRELLLVYDINSNIEKWWGLVVALKNYANVTVVDLPGLGGMDSFYSIGLKPTLDNMADYLSSFIKLKYKRKTLSVMGIGFGFVALTRMLQRSPEIESKVDLVVCLNGYAHKDDLKFTKAKKQIRRAYSYLCSTKPISDIVRLTLFNRPFLEARYPISKMPSRRGGLSREFARQFKIDLIQATDFRTRMRLNIELLKLDNCKSRINKTLWHITTSRSDPEVDQKLIEQHFRVIFDQYNHLPTKIGGSMPIVLNDQKLALKFMPAKLRRQLRAHG